jgi:hypothetical protein
VGRVKRQVPVSSHMVGNSEVRSGHFETKSDAAVETEAAPIRYVAEVIGADTDSERAIRWLIALMVLCCDPLAIALTAAARRSGA